MFKIIFADEHHDLKLTQKLNALNIGYHSANVVVLIGYIASAMYNLTMAATVDQNHVDQIMETILQLTETNKILG